MDKTGGVGAEVVVFRLLGAVYVAELNVSLKESEEREEEDMYPVLFKIDQVPARAARTVAGFTILIRSCKSKPKILALQV